MANRARKRPATFAKKVQAVIKRNAETKSIQFFIDNTAVSDYKTGQPAFGPNSMTVIPLTPDGFFMPISQGAGQAQRIGNQIALSKVTLRGIINARTFNTDEDDTNNEPMPFLFKMWIGYQKDTALNYVDGQLPQFFQSGGTSVDPDGTLMDTFRKVNTDKYVVVATRTFKVGAESIINSQATTANSYNQLYANNDFKFVQQFSIDVTKHCVKNVKYNDTGLAPMTRGLYWWYEAINPVGVNMTVNRFPCNLSYEIDVQYKDI